MPSSPVASARTALREAAAAFAHGRRAQRADVVDEDDYRLLTADVARAMEALAALLRATGGEITPTSGSSNDFQDLVHQVAHAATLARRAGGVDGADGAVDGGGPVSPVYGRTLHATPDD